MTQEQIIKELIHYITNMMEPERTMFLLSTYEFTKKVKTNIAGGASCCF